MCPLFFAEATFEFWTDYVKGGYVIIFSTYVIIFGD